MPIRIEPLRRPRLPRAIVCAWIASFAHAVGDRMAVECYIAEMLSCMNTSSHGDWS